MSRKYATVEELRAAEAGSGLGGRRVTCAECGRAVTTDTKPCPTCRSLIFTITEVPAVPFELGQGGALVGVTPPSQPDFIPLAAEDAAALKRAAEAGRIFVLALIKANAAAQRAANLSPRDPRNIGYLADKLLTASATGGDFSIEHLKPFARPVLAISDLIETTLSKLEEERRDV